MAAALRPLSDRFWEKVDKNGPTMLGMATPCHLWTGSLDSKGYGQIWLEGRLVQASRVALLLSTGALPEKNALHHCDNPPCVREDHLFDGTQKENAEDCVQKRRKATGARTNRTHLTQALVDQLRQEAASGVPQNVLMEKYSLSSGGISRIIRGTRWPIR